MESFDKAVAEQYLWGINTTQYLPPLANAPTGATAAAYLMSKDGNQTADNTVLTSTTCAVSAPYVYVPVKAGVNGKAYKIIVLITYDDGSKLEYALLMNVKNN